MTSRFKLKLLHCAFVIGTAVTAYLTLANSGAGLDLTPSYIMAQVANKWSEGVLNGTSDGTFMAFSNVMLLLGSYFMYKNTIGAKIKEDKIAKAVNKKKSVLLHLQSYMRLGIFSTIMVLIASSFGSLPLTVGLVSGSIISKLYCDIGVKLKLF